MKTSKNGNTKFYTFRQNNSGGNFVFDPVRGISIFVCIEATSAADAKARAEGIGLYFDGFGDCRCCGDRWSDWLDDEDGTDIPSDGYGPDDKGVVTPLWESDSIGDRYGLYRDAEWPAIVHYFDGSIKGYRVGDSKTLREAV